MKQRCGSCKKHLELKEFAPSYHGDIGRPCRKCAAAYCRGERIKVDHEPQRCARCGEQYVPKQLKAAASYCSRACKYRAKNAKAAATRVSGKLARSCLHCAATIGPERRSDAVFCSAECNYKAHALQRKYRARTGDQSKMGYVRAMICERDRWRCGICGGSVDRKRSHPDPLCASLDHIVPVSEGGDNAVTNLRLTHLRCNLSRRNRGGSEQLFLI